MTVPAFSRALGVDRLLAVARDIGWEAVFELAEELSSQARTVGPPGDQLVTCPHVDPRGRSPRFWVKDGACIWCCGTGRVTAPVAHHMRVVGRPKWSREKINA